jgi:hypothetical protein
MTVAQCEARPTISAVLATFAGVALRSGCTLSVPNPSCGIVVPSFNVTCGISCVSTVPPSSV